MIDATLSGGSLNAFHPEPLHVWLDHFGQRTSRKDIQAISVTPRTLPGVHFEPESGLTCTTTTLGSIRSNRRKLH